MKTLIFYLLRRLPWLKKLPKEFLKITPFDVQLIGAIVLHQGKIAEMQTGEGKTLAAVFPAYFKRAFGQGSARSYF